MGDRLSTAASTGFAWIVPDLHGNVAAQCSSAGSVSDVFRYDAYGKLIGTSLPAGTVPSPWRFQGRILESTAGSDTYDFGARAYVPDLGTFTSLDSVAGSAQNPITLNRYLYANANPATLVDPDGHCSLALAGANAQASAWCQAAIANGEQDTSPPVAPSQKTTTDGKAIAPSRRKGKAGSTGGSGSQVVIPGTTQATPDAPPDACDRNPLLCARSTMPGGNDPRLLILGMVGIAGAIACLAACEILVPAAIACIAAGLCELAAGGTAVLCEEEDEACQQTLAEVKDELTLAAERNMSSIEVGASRTERVADAVRGQVVNMEVKGLPGYAKTDVDVIGPNGELIEVGGASKSMSELGDQLRSLMAYGNLIQKPVYFYYAPNTPQNVINQAIEKLGASNVMPIPPMGG
jgi:RHS repeat-associated protein